MINWGLLGPPPDVGGHFAQGVQMGQALVAKKRTESALRAYLTNPTAPEALSALAAEDPDLAFKYSRLAGENAKRQAEAESIAATKRIGQQYLTDPEGAKASAIGVGQFDLAKTLSDLGPDKGKKATDYYKVAGAHAYRMKQMRDPAQRRAYFEQVKPLLLDSGADPNTLAAFDPTNETQLDAFITQAQTVNDLVDQGKVTWRSKGEFGEYAVDAMGRPVGNQNPFATQGDPPPAQGSSGPTVSLGGIKAPAYAQESSGYRDLAKNKAVGGVPNSFHTKRDAAGNPLARDFVPSGGQTMAQLEADLRAANPDKDVINEGDHVHVEPRGSAAPAQTNDLEAMAADAIAKGADPNEVRARLAQLKGGNNFSTRMPIGERTPHGVRM
jgi:hypothetical protein